MPRQVVKKQYFSFVGGLNTEAGYLTFPPNVWKEGDNVIPNVDGSISIRNSFNLEDSFANGALAIIPTDKETLAFGSHEWDSVGGDGTINYIVEQLGRYIYIYDNTGAATSATEKTGTYVLDLQDYATGGYPLSIGVAPIQVASAAGKLLVTSEATDPILLEETSGALTVTIVNLLYRDFKGLVEASLTGTNVDTRPSTLSDTHHYNLKNQGWSLSQINSFFTSQSVYPANNQQWFVGKDTSDNFDAALLVKTDFGKTRAPTGRFLLNPFKRDRTAVSEVANLAVETEDYRPSACTFFAGRAWYAGTRSVDIGNWLLFSQVADSKEKFGACYQDADPTSEEASDLVDSDGGVVVIHGIGTIKKLVPLAGTLVVFADNGVWAIKGTISSGFAATGYEVELVSTIGCLSPSAVVQVDNQIFYWSRDGIWIVSIDPTTKQLAAKSITEASIATLFQAIDGGAKLFASGRHSQEEKKIYWMYQDNPNADGLTDRYKKNRMLVLDLRLGAFFTHTVTPLAANSPEIVDLIVTKNFLQVTDDFDVIDLAGALVVDAAAAQVTAEFTYGINAASALKFSTLNFDTPNWKHTFANFEDGATQASKYMDWYASNSVGISYTGYIITGYDIGAQQGGDRDLQGLYITTLMKRTETGISATGAATNDSSVLMSIRWNFDDTGAANKWRDPVEVYRHNRLRLITALPASSFDDGQPVVITKHKIRGRGKAFQLKFASTAQKDFQLIGWSIPVLSNVD